MSLITVEKLQTQVDEIASDLSFLKKETSKDVVEHKTKDLERKTIVVKDEIQYKIDELSALWDSYHAAEIAKLETMLVVLETSTSELGLLKAHVYVKEQSAPVSVPLLQQPSVVSWWAKKNSWRLLGWSAVGLLGWSLFRKKKKDSLSKEQATTSKSGFFSTVGKTLLYGWLAVGWFFGIKSLVGKEKYHDALDRLRLRKRPEAPAVAADDKKNSIVWLLPGMEYSVDNGKTYMLYYANRSVVFSGDQKVLVRIAKTNNSPESKAKELVFTRAIDGWVDDSPQISQSINLTPEELTKRNVAITKSIEWATSFPVSIDYWWDKQNLESKWCPTTIDFDQSKQAIMLGTTQLKVSVGSFDTQTSLGKARVDDVKVNAISYASDKFVLNVTWSGKVWFISRTDTQDVELTKKDILSLLQPYYQDNKSSYSVSLSDADNTTIPISISVVWWTSFVARWPDALWIESEFARIDATKQSQYTQIGDAVGSMYAKIMSKSSLWTSSLPPLLAWTPDPLLLQWASPASVLFMLDQKYGRVDAMLNDGFLGKIENKTDVVLNDVVDFFSQYHTVPLFGWLISGISQGVDSLIVWGNYSEEWLRRKLKDDPVALEQFKILIKKISIVRFFLSEKRKMYSQKLLKNPSTQSQSNALLKENFDQVSLVWQQEGAASLYTTLQKNKLLNNSISLWTSVGIKVSKEVANLQKKIESTRSSIDLEWKRGKIEFDYEKQEIVSYGKRTKIEIVSDGTYKIAWFSVLFTQVHSLVRVANMINYMMHTYAKNYVEKLVNNTFSHCLNWHNEYIGQWTFAPWIYENATMTWPANINTPDSNRILKKSTLFAACPTWWDEEAKAFVEFLNKKFTSLTLSS